MKLIYTFLLTLLFFSSSIAQNPFELGISLGATAYFGDITPEKPFDYVTQTHLIYGVFGRFNLNEFVSLRPEYNRGWIRGSDEYSPYPSRNIDFRTSIQEINLLVEYYFTGFQPHNLQKPFSPYIFIGPSYFTFNPQRKYKGDWIDLQPLGTEGQGTTAHPGFEKYELNQWAILFGGGVKFAINSVLTFGIEFGIRKTYTDYLDDVGDRYANDLTALVNENGFYAGVLSWPNSIYTDVEVTNENYPAGKLRGNILHEDWYASGNLNMSYTFINQKYVTTRNPFTNIRKCFKF